MFHLSPTLPGPVISPKKAGFAAENRDRRGSASVCRRIFGTDSNAIQTRTIRQPGRGRKKALGQSPMVRKICGLRAWKMVLDITESKVREQVIENDEVVDMVPSIKERREAATLVLLYCWGMPV